MCFHACRVEAIEAKYYANGEDAYEMRKYFGSARAGKRKGSKKGSANDSSSSSMDKQQTSTSNAAGAAADKQAVTTS